MLSRAIDSRSMIIFFPPKSQPQPFLISSRTRFLLPYFSFEGRRPRKFTSEKFRKKTKMKKTPTFSFLFKARTGFLLPYFPFEGRRPRKFMLELSEETRKKTKMKKPAADPPPPPIWLFQKQSSVKTKKTGGFSVEEIHGADKFEDGEVDGDPLKNMKTRLERRPRRRFSKSKESKIEGVCRAHYQDFITAVDDLRSLLPDVPYRAILLYNSMIFRGVGVDKFTFPFVMKACLAISCLKKAKEIYGFAVKSGFHGDVYLDNVLMDMYMKCGALNDALKVFDKMRHRSIVSWATIIAGLVLNIRVDTAQKVFDTMPMRNVVAWTSMIHGYAKSEKPEMAFELYAEMECDNVKPNEYTLVSLLMASAKLENLQMGRRVYEIAIKNGFEIGIFSRNISHRYVQQVRQFGIYEDEEVVILLKNMKTCLERRPRGFGEGKVYGTSIEDKLMDEIEWENSLSTNACTLVFHRRKSWNVTYGSSSSPRKRNSPWNEDPGKIVEREERKKGYESFVYTEASISFSHDMDDEYEKLIRRRNPPRVVIDNESCKHATVIQVDSANKQGILLEVVQVLNDLNLMITKAYICSDDGRWFMDVFNVTNDDGNKITDEGILDYIQSHLVQILALHPP